MIDSGSQCTLIRKDLAVRLDCNGKADQLKLDTITGEEKSIPCQSTALKIKSMDDKFVFNVERAFAFREANFNVNSQILPKDFEKDPRWKFAREAGVKNVHC